jgi:deoxycytidylate deaminase
MDPLHATLLRVAYIQATNSHDPSSQNGAALIRYQPGGYHSIALGYNHIPHKDGAELASLLADRNKKYPRVIHAEADVIARAARSARGTVQTTLVCPWAACLSCVGPILQAGISRIVMHKQRLESPYQAWNAGIAEAHAWLLDAGVELLAFDGPVPGAPTIRIDYKEWDPCGGSST